MRDHATLERHTRAPPPQHAWTPPITIPRRQFTHHTNPPIIRTGWHRRRRQLQHAELLRPALQARRGAQEHRQGETKERRRRGPGQGEGAGQAGETRSRRRSRRQRRRSDGRRRRRRGRRRRGDRRRGRDPPGGPHGRGVHLRVVPGDVTAGVWVWRRHREGVVGTRGAVGAAGARIARRPHRPRAHPGRGRRRGGCRGCRR